MLLKPKALKPNATFGIVSPGEWLEDARFNKGIKTLEAMGYSLKSHPDFEHNHRLAGSDEERARAINDMFADPEVDAIICSRGGTGSFRTLEHLDHDIIRENPKIFCGYSDITMLLHHIHQQTGLVTFHGPMLTSFQGRTAFNEDAFKGDIDGQIKIMIFDVGFKLDNLINIAGHIALQQSVNGLFRQRYPHRVRGDFFSKLIQRLGF